MSRKVIRFRILSLKGINWRQVVRQVERAPKNLAHPIPEELQRAPQIEPPRVDLTLFRRFRAVGKEIAVTARPSKYSPELGRRAVIEVTERGFPIFAVARDLRIGSPETLRNWVKKARREAGLEVAVQRLRNRQRSAACARRCR